MEDITRFTDLLYNDLDCCLVVNLHPMFHAAKVTSIKVKVIRSILQNDNKNSSFSQASVNVYI
jgi:energy-converting hydrogenase A subunit M